MKQTDPLLHELRALGAATPRAAHEAATHARAEAAFIAQQVAPVQARMRRPSLMLAALVAWGVLYVVVAASELDRVFVRERPLTLAQSASPDPSDLTVSLR